MSDPVVLTQDDPAGSYITLRVDPAFANQSVLRCLAIIPKYADGSVGPALFAGEIDSAIYSDGGVFSLNVSYRWASQWTEDPAVIFPLAALAGAYPVVFVHGPQMPAGELLMDDCDVNFVTHPPVTGPIESSAGRPLPGNPIQPISGGRVVVTKTGNALYAAVAWDPTGGITITSMKWGVTDFDLIETVTVGGSSGYKLSTFVLKNQTATNMLIALPTVWVTFSGDVNEFAAFACEIQNCTADPKDTTVSASGSDALPTTAAGADTVAANEVAIAAMLVSGQDLTQLVLPTPPEGYSFLVDAFGGVGPAIFGTSALQLCAYRKNVIAIDNFGFATSLPAAVDWAVQVTSFQ